MSIEEIQAKLEKLRALDPNFNIFGSAKHRYELGEPLSEKSFRSLEEKYNCVFPEDYKIFITQLGNGGAGPYYGFFPIEVEDHNHGYCSWAEGGLITDLSKPFPFCSEWNLSDEFWDNEPDPDENTPENIEEEMWEKWEAQLEEKYWNIMDGAIPICHQGCAVRNWLVVSGSEKGTVWVDYRGDQEGIAPLATASGARLSFTKWYLDWLNKSIKECENA